MNKIETTRILKLVAGAYPKTFNIDDPDKLSIQMEIWSSCFESETYMQVAQALKYHISTDTSGFPPVLGKLKEAIFKIGNPNVLSEAEAWAYVKVALKNSLYGSEEEFDKLPPIVQKVVGSGSMLRSWAMNDSDEINTVIASNFQRSYRSILQSHKENAMLPDSVKKAIGLNNVDIKRIGD